ncbi:hypothetical protein LXL04_032612 [Taraxacum kok-saghyz]
MGKKEEKEVDKIKGGKKVEEIKGGKYIKIFQLMAKKEEKEVDEIKGEKKVDEIKGGKKVEEKKPAEKKDYKKDEAKYSDSQEFGRDTNKLEYFRTAPFNVHGDNHFSTRIADYGGGRNRDHGIVERGSATSRADGSYRTREDPNGIFASDGGSRRRHDQFVAGPRLDQGRGSAIVRPGGSYWVQEDPFGGFPNNGSHDLEPEVQRLVKQEGINVPMPMAVAVVVMMMLMVVVMVVLVLVLVLVWVMLKTAVT